MEEIQKQELTSMDIKEAQLLKLKELFPEAFTEGLKVDWDKLRLTLGDETVDTGKERYGMNWPGKADCFKTIQQPSIATLSPARDESIDFDTTQNLFIEGDNLEVLKLLQKSYLGKIKMIYIDPPYNTGNEFIYPDNFSESLDTYLEYTNQKDGEGRKWATNAETDGRYHSKWMNMLYPRLFLAKNLLKEDGVIFISIDDNEVTNLRLLCNEIFGEENFISNIIWEKRFTRSNNAKLFTTLTEHILLYRKSENLESLKEPRNEKSDSIYSNPDNDIRGVWTSVSYVNPATKEQRPNLVYEIENPISKQKVRHPTNAWKYEYNTYVEHAKNNNLYWGQSGNNIYPRLKKFLSEMQAGMVPANLWNHENTGTTDQGSKILEELFGLKIFDFPKPPSLIKRMMGIGTQPNDNEIVLDFFAGSATTAHAVMDLNNEDGGNRKFICVQIPEPTDEKTEAYRAGYKTIADISKERIRKVSTKLKKEQSEAVEKSKNELFESKQMNILDLGFKVCKLQKSNFKVWDATLEKTPEVIQQKLFEHIQHISPEAQQEAILYELLLKSGFELTTHIAALTLAGKTVFSIAEGQLLICLEKEITHDCIKAMAEKGPSRVICLDEAFTGTNADALKTNTVQIMKSKGVVNFRTI
jgi:adenine-specific DNA-methyltransferase